MRPDLGGPTHPTVTGSCKTSADLISIYKTTSYFLFNESARPTFDAVLSRGRLQAIALAAPVGTCSSRCSHGCLSLAREPQHHSL